MLRKKKEKKKKKCLVQGHFFFFWSFLGLPFSQVVYFLFEPYHANSDILLI